jgi:flavin reductase (DIM6/NTAB) family NADH-FMN oxidoreductase RutF
LPRVAESPVAIECTLHSTLGLGDSTVVFGRVVAISAWESAVRDGPPAIEHLQPLARLGGNEWSTIGEVEGDPAHPLPGRGSRRTPSMRGSAVRRD